MERLFPRRRIRQKWQNLLNFMERSWPSMYKNQRNRILGSRSFMHEMNRHFPEPIHVNGHRELW